jgi:hypothetical protein
MLPVLTSGTQAPGAAGSVVIVNPLSSGLTMRLSVAKLGLRPVALVTIRRNQSESQALP